MANILFLGRHETRPGYETPEKFVEILPEYFGEDHQIYGAHFDELLFDCQPGKVTVTDLVNNKDLADYDFVCLVGWFKDWKDIAFAVAIYLDHHKVRFMNPEALHQISRSKVSQAVLYGLNNLSIPRTIFIPTYTKQVIGSTVENLGLPLIFKEANGHKGKNNHIVRTKQELESLLADPKNQGLRFIAQEYIPSTGDFRVITANNKIYMVVERKGQGDTHLHNTSQGAAATELPVDSLPEDILKACIEGGNLVNRPFCGSDVIKSTENGQYYLLECNNFPQMLTGALPERKAEVFTQIIKDTMSLED